MKIFNLPTFSLKSFSLPININLQRREKMAVAIAAGVLLILLFFQLLVFPIIDRRDRLRREIKSKTEALQTIQKLNAEYQALSHNTLGVEARLNKRPKTFTLFSFIDRLAGRNNIKGNIAYMKPSTANIKNSSYKLSTVEMKVTALTMQQLTALLHGIEQSANVVWVRRITLSKDDKNEGLLNTVLQVETLQR